MAKTQMMIGKTNPSCEIACTNCQNTGKIQFHEEDSTFRLEGFGTSGASGEFHDPRLDVQGYELSTVITSLKPECNECGRILKPEE